LPIAAEGEIWFMQGEICVCPCGHAEAAPFSSAKLDARHEVSWGLWSKAESELKRWPIWRLGGKVDRASRSFSLSYC